MHRLAPHIMRNTKPRNFKHSGMRVEGILYLDGIDIFPAGDNHVFGSIDDVDVIIFIYGCQVARVHPTIYNGGSGRFRHTPIAWHYIRPPRNDLPDFSTKHIFNFEDYHAHILTQKFSYT